MILNQEITLVPVSAQHKSEMQLEKLSVSEAERKNLPIPVQVTVEPGPT